MNKYYPFAQIGEIILFLAYYTGVGFLREVSVGLCIVVGLMGIPAFFSLEKWMLEIFKEEKDKEKE